MSAEEGGAVSAVDELQPGDFEAILDRTQSDTQAHVADLTARIMAEVERDLAAEGESRSPEQMEGLRWAAEVIARKAYGVAEPLFYVSPLDTGVGKTLLMIAATRVIMRDPSLRHVGIVLFINRRELADELLKRLGLSPNDQRLSVFFRQNEENLRWNSLGVGPDLREPGTKKPKRRKKQRDGTCEYEPNPNYVPPPQDAAQLLITNQVLFKSRSRWGRNFATNELWHYHGAPRAIRIWDETSPPADGITLTAGEITAYADNLPADKQADLIRWVEQILRADNDTPLSVPAWPPELAKILRKTPKLESETEQRVRTALLGLSGKLVRVLKDDYFKATIITYETTLPINLAPMLILDAGANEKEIYREWARRRGNLVIGSPGRKECPVRVKHWNHAAGRTQHRTPSKKAKLVEGAVVAYQEALAMGAERVLLVTFKPEKPSYAIEPDVRARLYELGIDDTPLEAITWGGQTTATNAFKDIRHQIQVGQFQLPMKDYIAMQRGAAGVLDKEPFDMKRAHAVRRSEVASSYDQAVGRGATRKMIDGKCTEPVYVWTIFSTRGRMGIPRETLERPGANVEDWSPLEVTLRGGAKKTESRPCFVEAWKTRRDEWLEAKHLAETVCPRKGGDAPLGKQIARRMLLDVDVAGALQAEGFKIERREMKRRGGTAHQYRLSVA